MPLTLPDLCDKLRRLDEITLLELLNLNSEDLVNSFQDIIEDKADFLEELLDDN
tara:strand:+ start:4453 stop:4614 length:162 start_codon:yes stop_codon:yes gene_type:complete